jgi:hypothetical protein
LKVILQLKNLKNLEVGKMITVKQLVEQLVKQECVTMGWQYDEGCTEMVLLNLENEHNISSKAVVNAMVAEVVATEVNKWKEETEQNGMY